MISAEQSGGVSVGFMKGILESPADKDFDGSWTVVDVRDVAAAHLLAAEKQAAKGRWGYTTSCCFLRGCTILVHEEAVGELCHDGNKANSTLISACCNVFSSALWEAYA